MQYHFIYPNIKQNVLLLSIRTTGLHSDVPCSGSRFSWSFLIFELCFHPVCVLGRTEVGITAQVLMKRQSFTKTVPQHWGWL